MKILAAVFMVLIFISSSADAQYKFEVLNTKIEQGGVVLIKIAPQWQGPGIGVKGPCMDYKSKSILPNMFGDIFIAIGVDCQPGYYRIFLTEYEIETPSNIPPQYIEVVEKKFPETKIRKKLVPLNSAKRMQEVDEINKAYGRGNSWFDRTEGDFVLPLNDIFITDDFGRKRTYINAQTRHGGVDLRAPRGTDVKAINSGVVLMTANNFSLEGNMVIIDHGSDIFSLYLHLSNIKVIQGMKVKKGDVIGLSGSTGAVNGPHLHFMIKVHGTNIDPLGFIDTINQLIQ